MSLSCSENLPSLHHSDLYLSVLPSSFFYKNPIIRREDLTPEKRGEERRGKEETEINSIISTTTEGKHIWAICLKSRLQYFSNIAIGQMHSGLHIN